MACSRYLVLATALLLAGCMTPHSKPQVSQAVMQARAARAHPAANGCPTSTLADVSPTEVGFGFGEASLPDMGVPASNEAAQPLVKAVPWLTCNAAVPVVIKPDADTHGTDAEQDALARSRAEAVRGYLTAHGVAAERITILARGAAEPAGEHLLVLAEGRRW